MDGRGGLMDEIDLEGFLRANESELRWRVETLVLDQLTRVIGREDLAKVTLSFRGSALDNLALCVEASDDLKARIQEALLGPQQHLGRHASSGRATGPEPESESSTLSTVSQPTAD
jgi:hypothetical protein